VRKKGKENFDVLDSSLVGCGTGKGDFPQEDIVYICSIEQWKNNGF